MSHLAYALDVTDDVRLEFDWNDAFPTHVLVADPGDDVRELAVVVVDGFNAAARMSIGTSADPELLVAESDVNLRVAGDYRIPRTWIAPAGGRTTTTLYLFLNKGASTSGIFRVYFIAGDAPDKGGP